VIVAVAGDSVMRLVEHPNAVDWLRDAFAHLKVIGHVHDSTALFERAGFAQMRVVPTHAPLWVVEAKI